MLELTSLLLAGGRFGRRLSKTRREMLFRVSICRHFMRSDTWRWRSVE